MHAAARHNIAAPHPMRIFAVAARRRDVATMNGFLGAALGLRAVPAAEADAHHRDAARIVVRRATARPLVHSIRVTASTGMGRCVRWRRCRP